MAFGDLVVKATFTSCNGLGLSEAEKIVAYAGN